MTDTTERPLQVVLLSPCGWGNLGDAAIQDSVIAGIRRHLGDGVKIVGLTQNPRDTVDRHGIEAYPLAGNSHENYSVGPAVVSHAPETLALVSATPGKAATPAIPLRARIKSLVMLVPTLHRTIRAIANSIRRLRAEIRHSQFLRGLLAESDLLIVSGGGQLDELWGGPWGHPFTIYKTARIAHRSGCKTAVLSVGAGTLKRGISRRLVRRALQIAQYKSFRDPRTVRLLESFGVKGDLHRVPDLAFGHPTKRPTRRFASAGAPLTIALSPIAYKHPDVWPDKDSRFFHAYLDKLAVLGVALLSAGHRVVILTSDTVDDKVARELAARMAGKTPLDDTRAAQVVLPASTNELLQLFIETDILVASRLHGVLLAQIVATPVIAISYDWKVDEQMGAMEYPQYCLPIDNFDVTQAQSAIAAASLELAAISAQLTRKSASAYDRIDAQYAEIFGLIGADPGK